MKKYLLAFLAALLLVLTIAFLPVNVNADGNSSPGQGSPQQSDEVEVSDVTLNGVPVSESDFVITSMTDAQTGTSEYANALVQANKELTDAKTKGKDKDGKEVTYIDFSKLGIDKELDKVAESINKDYNSSVFQVVQIFEFSLPNANVSKTNPVKATFSKDTTSNVTVIHKVGEKWAVVDAADVTQTQDSVTVTFTSLCPIAFLEASSTVVPSGSSNLLWILLIILAVIILAIIIILLLRRKPKDKVVTEEGAEEAIPATDEDELMENQVEEAEGTPQEEEPAQEEAPQEEETQEELQEEKEPEVEVIPVETYENVADDVSADNKYIAIQLNRSFLAKLAESGEECQGYYNKVKNELAAYGLKGKPAWKYENYRKGMDFPVKIQVKGKTLYLYLALDPENVDARYRVKNVGESKKFSATPVLFKVKGPRKAKYAVELVDLLGEKLGLTKGDVDNVNYCEEIQGLTEAELIEKGLIKVKAERTTEVDERTRKVAIEEEVSANETSELLSDRDANNLTQTSNRYADPTKKAQISVADLCNYFEEGEIANLEEIKNRVPEFDPEATFLEVTGEGSANKAIIVDCDEISLEAAKMILLVGGKVMKSMTKEE
ncbi:hypothetical protein J6Y73_00830 [bacterium]|nr:hypothetical protein [bacterium]